LLKNREDLKEKVPWQGLDRISPSRPINVDYYTPQIVFPRRASVTIERHFAYPIPILTIPIFIKLSHKYKFDRTFFDI